jgi:hypothetical protein
MKTQFACPSISPEPSEEDIRNYAYRLYQESGYILGHDIDNWLEASACLKGRADADQRQAVEGPEVCEAPPLGDQAGRVAHALRMCQAADAADS